MVLKTNINLINKSDETSSDVCRSSPPRSASAEVVRRPRRTDGVEARTGEEAAGEVRSLIVLPPDDTGQRGVEGVGDGVEDVSGVSVERREGAVVRNPSQVTAKLVRPFVELKRETQKI